MAQSSSQREDIALRGTIRHWSWSCPSGEGHVPRRRVGRTGTHAPARDPATPVGTWTWAGRGAARGGGARPDHLQLQPQPAREMCPGATSSCWESFGVLGIRPGGDSGGAAVAMASRGNCQVRPVHGYSLAQQNKANLT